MKSKLSDVYQKWNSEVLEKFINEYSKNEFSEVISIEKISAKFSEPFYMGVLEQEKKEKSIMIIGQEARKFGCYPGKRTISDIQDYCKCFIEKQLYNKCETPDIKYSNSAFWRLFRVLNDTKIYSLYWNNLDKIHKYYKDKTKPLCACEEIELNKQFGEDNKSLLQREIDIVNPDVIIFVTGPHYRKSMCTSFGIDEKSLDEMKFDINNFCFEIHKELRIDKQVFWTYHPNYLNRRGKFKEYIDKILSIIK